MPETIQLIIFLTHKVIPGTFPSLLKVALGKQEIYLRLTIDKKKKFVPKKQQIFPIFWHSLPIFISLHRYFAGKTYIFLKAWPMYNKVKTNIGLIVNCVLSIIFTHIWPQNMLRSSNTVLDDMKVNEYFKH